MIVQKRFIAIFLSSTPLEMMPLCSAADLRFIIIPAGVIALLAFDSRDRGTEISNGGYFFGYF
jgi:hypothetical protein